jgi:hypothetical protein
VIFSTDRSSPGLLLRRKRSNSSRDAASFDEVAQLWGGRDHWRIFDSLDIKKCPRCTYQPHKQIYERVIVKDSMTYKFI